MQPSSAADYKQLLSEVIKKQIVILGPDITLSKARNVKGITVADDGTVTNLEGSPQEVTQALIDQFVQLSGLIVKKTMEPLLSLSQSAPYQNGSGQAPIQPAAPTATPPPVTAIPVETVPVQPQPATVAPVAVSQMPAEVPVSVGQPATPTMPEQTPQPIAPSAQSSPAQSVQATNQPQRAPMETTMQPDPTGVSAQSNPIRSGTEAQLEPAKNPLAA